MLPGAEDHSFNGVSLCAMKWSRGREAPLLLALALAAGYVDAVSYLGLGRVFTANMTGNTVLLGVAVAGGSSAEVLRALAALGGFCLGGATGMAIIGAREGNWPGLTWPVFGLEVAALAALLAIWQAAGAGSARYVLVALAGVAMGTQSAAVRISDISGVNTTYMTSTMLNALARIVPGARQQAPTTSLPALAWVIYALGAVAGAGAGHGWHAPSVAVPLAIVGMVAGLTVWWRRPEPPSRSGRLELPGTTCT
jgi:uncharacterized membrane protein YoaK (UPF0700 family)